MSEENLRYTIEHGIYGTPKGSSELKSKIRVGDHIIVYVGKIGCSELCESFATVLEVVSDWRRSSKPTWPDEVRDNEVKYPWVIDVRVLASGKVPIDEVYSELSKILPLEKSQGKLSKSKRVIGFGTKLRIFGMNFSKKTVPNELCELIMRRLRAINEAMF
jgi:predicted RNA-binding protein